MEKINSSMKNMVLSLGLITIAASLILGSVYAITADKIAKAEVKAQVDAIKEVAPDFDNNPLEEKYVYISEPDKKTGADIIVYPAKNGGKLVGAAVKSFSMDGFSGEITVMYGFDAEGNINDYKVLKHAETAGLGSKMQEWFRMKNGDRCILGLNPVTHKMRVKKDGGNVDAITAATISSRAFLDALDKAYKAYMEFKENEEGICYE